MQAHNHGTVVMTPHARYRNTKDGTAFTFAGARSLITDFAETWSSPTALQATAATQNAAFCMPLRQLQLIRPGAEEMAFIFCMNRNANGRNGDSISAAVAGINKNNQALNSLIFEKWWSDDDWLMETSVIPQGITEKVINVNSRYLPVTATGAAAARRLTSGFAAQWQQLKDDGAAMAGRTRAAMQPLAFSVPATTVDEWAGTPELVAVTGMFGYNMQKSMLTFIFVGIDGRGRPVTAPCFPGALPYTVEQAGELMEDMLTYDFL